MCECIIHSHTHTHTHQPPQVTYIHACVHIFTKDGVIQHCTECAFLLTQWRRIIETKQRHGVHSFTGETHLSFRYRGRSCRRLLWPINRPIPEHIQFHPSGEVDRVHMLVWLHISMHATRIFPFFCICIGKHGCSYACAIVHTCLHACRHVCVQAHTHTYVHIW